jgi:hypothetical protein
VIACRSVTGAASRPQSGKHFTQDLLHGALHDIQSIENIGFFCITRLCRAALIRQPSRNAGVTSRTNKSTVRRMRAAVAGAPAMPRLPSFDLVEMRRPVAHRWGLAVQPEQGWKCFCERCATAARKTLGKAARPSGVA